MTSRRRKKELASASPHRLHNRRLTHPVSLGEIFKEELRNAIHCAEPVGANTPSAHGNGSANGNGAPNGQMAGSPTSPGIYRYNKSDLGSPVNGHGTPVKSGGGKNGQHNLPPTTYFHQTQALLRQDSALHDDANSQL